MPEPPWNDPSKEDAKPQPIFSTPLWHIEDELPKGALKWALDYKKSHPMEHRRSNRGGYQSYPTHDYSDFKYREYMLAMLRFLPRFHFQNWWVNVNGKGAFNMQHTHPGSDLSIIWNITSNNNSLRLVNPVQHVRGNLCTGYSMHNRYGFEYDQVRQIDCKEGDIVIFPSDIEHYVEPHELRKERVTVSFNLAFNFEQKF